MTVCFVFLEKKLANHFSPIGPQGNLNFRRPTTTDFIQTEPINQHLIHRRSSNMEYDKSSHVSCWLFTEEEIMILRAKANRRAQMLVQNQAKKTVESDLHAHSLPKPSCFAKNHDTTSNMDTTDLHLEAADFPSPEEETALVNFYCCKLLNLIGPSATVTRLKRDIKVASTASLLLKRFYLSNSVICFDPKSIMVAAAFLAAKVEDLTCDIRYLEEGTISLGAHVQIEDILQAEIDLIAGVDYDLWCLHPYKSVLAITEDLRGFLKSKEGINCVDRQVSGEDLRPIYDLARDIVEILVFQSDILLMETPGKVAFAAMILANERLLKEGKENSNKDGCVQIEFNRYFHFRFGDNADIDTNQVWDDIARLVDAIRDSSQATEADLTALKAIHKKLKKYRVWGVENVDKKKRKKKRKLEDGEKEVEK